MIFISLCVKEIFTDKFAKLYFLINVMNVTGRKGVGGASTSLLY